MCASWVVLSAVSSWHNSDTQVFRHHFFEFYFAVVAYIQKSKPTLANLQTLTCKVNVSLTWKWRQRLNICKIEVWGQNWD